MENYVNRIDQLIRTEWDIFRNLRGSIIEWNCKRIEHSYNKTIIEWSYNRKNAISLGFNRQKYIHSTDVTL